MLGFPTMRRAVIAGAVLALTGCPSNDDNDNWQVVHRDLPGALMSVYAASADDVWAVGADSGDGSTLLHYDGAAWSRVDTGTTGDLWWIHGFPGGPMFAGGEDGQILRIDGVDQIAPMTTPGTGIVFGLWGSSPADMWAVGGNQGGASGAFAWHLDGDAFALADGFPTELETTDAIWKVFGRGAGDVCMVGTNGTVLRYDGSAITAEDAGASVSLFTVHGNADRLIAVGGFGVGALLENDGTGWVDASPEGAPQLIGVTASADQAYAVGVDGVVYRRGDDGVWALEPTGAGAFLPLHAATIDPDGGVWAVGGQVLSEPLVSGYMLHKGTAVPEGF